LFRSPSINEEGAAEESVYATEKNEGGVPLQAQRSEKCRHPMLLSLRPLAASWALQGNLFAKILVFSEIDSNFVERVAQNAEKGVPHRAFVEH